MRFKPRKSFVFIGLFLFLTTSIYLQLELPASTGTHAVGRTIFRWVDSSRSEALTEDPDDFREVIAMVWYPAEPGTGVKAGYFPDLPSVAQALAQSGEVEAWQVAGLRFVRLESRYDAKPLKDKNPFPVVILSPGNGTNIEFYSSLAGEIASHGYVVVGLNHPYDVPAVRLSGGEVAPYDKAQWLMDVSTHQEYIAERVKVRTADVIFALGKLDEMNANGSFAGLIDLDSVAVAGHSLGGIAASEACKADRRFKVCINFDGLQKGGPFSMEETTIPPEQPFLFLTKESQLHPKLLERFESMTESYWVVIHGATHQSFTDGPVIQPSLLPWPNEADRYMGLIRQYSLAFLDHTLKGHSNDLLANAHKEGSISVRSFPSN